MKTNTPYLPEVVYAVAVCPIGCSGQLDLVALQARDDKTMFLFCPLCGVAYRSKPDSLEKILTISDLAAEGIEFPDRATVAAEFGPDNISEQEFEKGHFWEAIILTYRSKGQPEKALQIVEGIVANWHQPPEKAYKIQEEFRHEIDSFTPY